MARALLIFLSFSLAAASLEDSTRALAKRIDAQLAANESAQIAMHNLSTLPRADAAHTQSIFEQSLRKRVRNASAVEITLTISENIKGYLLIADLKRGDQHIVEMEPYRPDPAGPPTRPALALTKKFLWQQATPILDLLVNDSMLVLDTSGVTRYDRADTKWAPDESASVPTTVRDPRGRMILDHHSLTIDLPGETCRGTWKPLAIDCGSGSVFSSGRNTFEGSPPFFSEAFLGGARVVAALDGTTHINEVAIDNWGSDVAAIATCAGPRLAVTGNSDQESADSITLFDLVETVPIRVTDALEFPGPVTALWPRADGALALVHNLGTHQYEAYGLTVDCSR